MKKVLLFGPKTVTKKNVYGGGVGGYTRNMNSYLKTFNASDLAMIPCYHSVRGEHNLHIFTPVYRLLKDTIALLRCIYANKPQAIHVLAQYRGAVLREFMVVMVAKVLHLKVIYDIKAGAFVSSYCAGTRFYRKLLTYIIKNADVHLAEGRDYIKFIQENFDRTPDYFPNFVPSEEIPQYRMRFQPDSPLLILFVGYAYKDKGVFELLDAVARAHQDFAIELTFIGEEHEDFSTYLDRTQNKYPQLIVNRLGVLSHKQVLAKMSSHNVYAYPTTHSGEGHNNSINEAMMNSLCIVTTHNGFLSDVLGGGLAHHIDKVTADDIYDALKRIKMFPEEANSMTRNAYEKLKNEYSSNAATKRLLQSYQLIGIEPSTVIH